MGDFITEQRQSDLTEDLFLIEFGSFNIGSLEGGVLMRGLFMVCVFELSLWTGCGSLLESEFLRV